MLTCAVSVANSATRQGSPIFLATDSKLVKDLARQMYGIVALRHWMLY